MNQHTPADDPELAKIERFLIMMPSTMLSERNRQVIFAGDLVDGSCCGVVRYGSDQMIFGYTDDHIDMHLSGQPL
jgi:hypothetical protein